MWFSYTLFLLGAISCTVAIHDPLNIFCGSKSCYDILKVEKSATLKEIKKSYRQLSLTEHPDKNKAENATATFQKITKAFEVLTGNESRKLFDYYLDHPTDYFKVSGHHYIRNIPHSDVRVVITVALLLISWFFHTVQYQKYKKVIDFLTNAALNNLGPKSGGTPQTLELHRRAVKLYDERVKELKTKGEKGTAKTKMLRDPLFEECVKEVVAGVKVEGGYRKPVWQDLIIVQFVMLPYNSVLWSMKYYRRYISKEPIPLEDRLEMTRDKVGLAVWDDLSEEKRVQLAERELWKDEENFQKWQEEQMAEYLKSLPPSKRKQELRRLQRAKRGRGTGSDDDEDDEFYDD